MCPWGPLEERVSVMVCLSVHFHGMKPPSWPVGMLTASYPTESLQVSVPHSLLSGVWGFWAALNAHAHTAGLSMLRRGHIRSSLGIWYRHRSGAEESFDGFKSIHSISLATPPRYLYTYIRCL